MFFFSGQGICLGLSTLFSTLMTWQQKIKTITLLTLPEWWIRLIIIIIYYYYYYYYHYYYCYHHHSLLCTVNVDPRILVSYSMCSLCQVNDLRQKAPFAECIMVVLAVPKSADFCKVGTCNLIPSLSGWWYMYHCHVHHQHHHHQSVWPNQQEIWTRWWNTIFFSFLHQQAVKVSSMNCLKHTIE